MKRLDEKGQLTIEFMLALILIISVSTLLGVLTFTLSLTEILQYVTYAGARAYFAGDMTLQNQQDAGSAKAKELIVGLPFLSGAEASKWIVVNYKGSQSTTGKGVGNYAGYGTSIGASTAHSQFEGFQLQLTVPMLDVKIPFIKDVITPPSGDASFSTLLSTFLTREPSFEECKAFLDSVGSIVQSHAGAGLGGSWTTVNIMDNGC